MARIEHLNISILQMNKQSLHELIHEIRTNRRIRPKPKARKQTARTKRTTAKRRNPTQADAFAMLENMSAEQRLKLIEKLKNGVS